MQYCLHSSVIHKPSEAVFQYLTRAENHLKILALYEEQKYAYQLLASPNRKLCAGDELMIRVMQPSSKNPNIIFSLQITQAHVQVLSYLIGQIQLEEQHQDAQDFSRLASQVLKQLTFEYQITAKQQHAELNYIIKTNPQASWLIKLGTSLLARWAKRKYQGYYDRSIQLIEREA